MCLSANSPVCRSVHYALGYPQHGRRKGLAVPSESICNSGFIETRDDILLVSSIYVSPPSAFRKTPSSESWFASTGGRCSSLADLLIYLRQDGCPRANRPKPRDHVVRRLSEASCLVRLSRSQW